MMLQLLQNARALILDWPRVRRAVEGLRAIYWPACSTAITPIIKPFFGGISLYSWGCGRLMSADIPHAPGPQTQTGECPSSAGLLIWAGE